LLAGEEAEDNRLLGPASPTSSTNWRAIMPRTKQLKLCPHRYNQVSEKCSRSRRQPGSIRRPHDNWAHDQTASAFTRVQTALSASYLLRTIAEWRAVVGPLSGFEAAAVRRGARVDR